MSSFVPKYEKIANDIRDKITSGEYPYNTIIPTEHQLMRKRNVSRHTVRKSLQILTDENLVYAIKGSGTYVNYNINKESVSKNDNIKIGLITTYISEYIFPSIIRGIENTLKKNNATLILSSTNNDYKNERDSIENLLFNGVRGLIIEPTKSNLLNPNLDYYLKLKKLNIPYVFINARYDLLDDTYVILNDFNAGFSTTSHLIGLNHYNIAIIAKYDDMQGKERLKGYLSAIKENSLYNTFIYTYVTGEEDSITKEFIKDYRKNNVSAVVCYNDNIASLVYKYSNANNIKIPDDLSVVSVDNSMISENLNITSYNHPKSKLGVKSAEILLDMIYNKSENYKNYCFEGTLIIRESTKSI